MPIDFRMEDEAGCAHDIVRKWDVGGHEVAVILHGRLDDPDQRRVATLVCACDYDYIELSGDRGRRLRNDPEKCMGKQLARGQLKNEASAALRNIVASAGLEEAVLEAHRKVVANEHLGQARSGIIYVQEVAELLGLQTAEVHTAVRRLYAQEKLDVDGMILRPFMPHFRFPEELRMMIRMMVETPLGWPNGDAGGCAIDALERAVHQGTSYKNGKDLFWPHNWPNVSPNHLIEFGIHFMGTAIGRGERDEEARKDLRYVDFEHVAKWLETAALRFRAFGKANGFPEKIEHDDAVGSVDLLDEDKE